MYVKGLLEMMFEVQSEWIDTFISDMESLAAAEGINTPLQLSGNGPPGSVTPPSSANTSPRGSQHSHTPSGMHRPCPQNFARRFFCCNVIRQREWCVNSSSLLLWLYLAKLPFTPRIE